MKRQNLILDWIPPTANERENIARTNKFMSAKIKKEQTQKVCMYAMDQLKDIYDKEKIVYIDVLFEISNFNRDEDNLIACFKYVNDGLVMSGIIKNDNLKHLRFKNFSYNKVKKKEEKIIIELSQ